MPSWSLKKVELEPYTEKLEPGDRALLGFCVESSSFITEHLWVRVFSQLHDGKAYLGTVEFQPSSIRDLSKGDQVSFLHEHIVKYHKAAYVQYIRFDDSTGALN